MPLTVRAATQADVPVLTTLWSDVPTPRRSALALPTTPDAIQERLAAALDDPDAHVLVAAHEDDHPVGMVLLRRTTIGLAATPAVQMSNVFVCPRTRRQGVGRALVAAAATFAEGVGVEQIVINVDPHRRDLNRYYARIGFRPVSLRRVATTAVLRRRLGLLPAVRLGIGPLIGARRSRITR